MMTRVITIVVVALVSIQAIALIGYRLAFDGQLEQRSPAAQAAALTQLLDAATTPEARAQIVAAAGGANAGISLLPSLPTDATEPLNRVLELIRPRLSENFPDRRLAVDPMAQTHNHFALLIQLKSGGYLRIAIWDRTTVRILWLPIGSIAGVAGLLIAIAAVLAVRHELKPLRRLANAVANDAPLAPQAMPEEGAPEIRELIRALNRMREKNATLIANRALTFAAISHDLRTYLTRLRLRLEMMPATNHRERAIANLEEMEGLIDQTIDFAGDHSRPATSQHCDPLPVLQACAEHYDIALSGQEGIDLAGAVSLSRRDLARVVNNLLDNAQRYAVEVEFSVTSRQDWLDIVVADRGPGIAGDKLGWIVEPFTRLEHSRNRELGGSGLGLAIVTRLVEEANGKLTLHERDGGGLCCRVELPLTPTNNETA